MDQIIQNLSFEAVTVPQDVMSTSASYATPIKVKIKMKKLDNIGHGVICVPKMKVSRTDKIRMVHSDETIMSFNVHMEPNGEAKRRRKSQNKFFHLFKKGKCVDIQSEEDDDPPYMLAPSAKLNQDTVNQSVLKLNRRNQRTKPSQGKNNIKNMNEIAKPSPFFFGKCKPGGCLDPPFGEDDYQYQSAVSPKKEFKGKDENKNQIAYSAIQIEDEQQTKDSKTPAYKNNCEERDTSTTLMLYKANSNRSILNQQYSDSIITYPTRTSSEDISVLEKNVSSRKSSAVKKGQLSTDTYFSPNRKRNSQEIKKELTKKNIVLKNSEQKEEVKGIRQSSNIIHSENTKLKAILQDHPSKIEEKNISKNLPESVLQPDYELLQLVEVSGNILLGVNHINESNASFDSKTDQPKMKSESETKDRVREHFDIDNLSTENIDSKSVNVMVGEKSILRIGQDITDEPLILNRLAITKQHTNASPEKVVDETTPENSIVQSYEKLHEEPTKNILIKKQQRKRNDIEVPTNHENAISPVKQLPNTHDVQNNLTIEVPINVPINVESYSKTSSKMNDIIIPPLEVNLTSQNFTDIEKREDFTFSSDFKKPSDQCFEHSSDLLHDTDIVLLNDNKTYETFEDMVERPIEDVKYINTIYSERTKDDVLEKKSSTFSITSTKRSLTDYFLSKETPEVKEVIGENENNLLNVDNNLERSIKTKLETSIDRDNLSKDGYFSYSLPRNIPIHTESNETNKTTKPGTNGYLLKGDYPVSNAPPDFLFNTVNTSADYENKDYQDDTVSIAPNKINKYDNNILKNNDIINAKNIPEVLDTTTLGQYLNRETVPSHENICNNIKPENSNLCLTEITIFKTVTNNDFNNLSEPNEIKSINNLLENSTTIITNSDAKNDKLDTNEIEKYIKNENISSEIYEINASPSKKDPYLLTDPQIENDHVVQKNGQLEVNESNQAVNKSLRDTNVAKQQISSVKSLSHLENQFNSILDKNIIMPKKSSLMETESHLKPIDNFYNTYDTIENSISHSNQLSLNFRSNKLKLLTKEPDNTKTNLSLSSSSIINNTEKPYLKSTANFDNTYDTRENSKVHSNQLSLDRSSNKLRLLTIMPENSKTNLSVGSSTNISKTKTQEHWETKQTTSNIHNNESLETSNDIKEDKVNQQVIREIKVNNKIQNVELNHIEIISKASFHQDTERNIKVDLGFQTYVNEKDAIVIKTFDASEEPKRFSGDKVFVINSALKLNDNELSFTINSDTRLSIKLESNKNIYDSEGRSFKTKGSHADDKTQNIYKNSRTRINASDGGALQETLSEIYENELVPIENLIKSLRVEIDRITKYRQIIRKKSITTTKKYKPIYYKKCICTRK